MKGGTFDITAIVSEVADTQEYDYSNCIVDHSLAEYDTKEFGILIRLNHSQTCHRISRTYGRRKYHHLVHREPDGGVGAPHLNPIRLIDVVGASEYEEEGDDCPEHPEDADVEEVLEEPALIEVVASRVDDQWQEDVEEEFLVEAVLLIIFYFYFFLFSFLFIIRSMLDPFRRPKRICHLQMHRAVCLGLFRGSHEPFFIINKYKYMLLFKESSTNCIYCEEYHYSE